MIDWHVLVILLLSKRKERVLVFEIHPLTGVREAMLHIQINTRTH
jgi:hypothetical protein